jgi:hypothetical protein
MFGISEADVAPIAPVAATYFRDPDMRNIGGWCLVPFCCGVVYGGSFSAKTSMIERFNPREAHQQWMRGETSEDMLGWWFHEEVAEWIADPSLRSTARARLQSWVAEKGVSPEVLEASIPYFALGIALETSRKGDNRRHLARYWSWIDDAGGSWLRLFFVAGMLLRDADGFPAQSFQDTILRITAEPMRSQIKQLFTLYQGR